MKQKNKLHQFEQIKLIINLIESWKNSLLAMLKQSTQNVMYF